MSRTSKDGCEAAAYGAQLRPGGVYRVNQCPERGRGGANSSASLLAMVIERAQPLFADADLGRERMADLVEMLEFGPVTLDERLCLRER